MTPSTATETPKQRTLQEVLADIELLNPELSEYLILFFDMMSEFETPVYTKNPEDVIHCFPDGMNDDQIEIISLMLKTVHAGTDLEEFRKILRELRDTLKVKEVTLWAMQPIFRVFIGRSPNKSQSKTEQTKSPDSENLKIKVPNLHYDRREVELFLQACNLKPESEGGKGSHVKWVDEKGNTMELSSGSKKAWLKNTIKRLLANGFPIKRIIKACETLKIEFEVIKL